MSQYYDEFEEERCTYSNFQRKCDDLYECKEIVKDILKKLYSDRSLDIKELEHDMGELCHVLKVDLPKNKLLIKRAVEPLPDYINDWIDRNNHYLKSLAI